ncbi:hypothetical protein CALVIDRAFT_190488 [Calocera viscosa TUFC12733]|uniref:Uncharacterized protein n=1 Tax=Calocera viscosa (strain TUFC12733) TaxID=1330018 RepID=A0A167KMI8_CALVF|nr:hypothetical protein CALVIDRAFT_190488 [Calocera viscosa TUFC12733]
MPLASASHTPSSFAAASLSTQARCRTTSSIIWGESPCFCKSLIPSAILFFVISFRAMSLPRSGDMSGVSWRSTPGIRAHNTRHKTVRDSGPRRDEIVDRSVVESRENEVRKQSTEMSREKV